MVNSGAADDARALDSYVFVNWGPEFQADHAVALPKLTHPGVSLDLGTLGLNYLLTNEASGYFPMRIAKPYVDERRLHLVGRAPRFVYPAFAVYPEERDEEAFDPFLEELRRMIEAL